MKEFFMTSTIPYWIVFALIAAAAVMEFICLRKDAVTAKEAKTISILAIAGTLLGLLIYNTVDGSVAWWCTRDEYGFFSKLLRTVPLFIFLMVQLAQVFIYQKVMEIHLQKELFLKTSFIAIIAILPIGLVLYLVLSIFGFKTATMNTIYTIIMILMLVGGVGWAMAKNVKSVGAKQGLIFTAVTFVMIIGGFNSLIVLLGVIIQLFVQMLACIAPFLVALWLFNSKLGDQMGKSSPMPHIFYDDNHNAHYNAVDRDSANKKIAESKQG